jgi:hypothetical protein
MERREYVVRQLILTQSAAYVVRQLILTQSAAYVVLQLAVVECSVVFHVSTAPWFQGCFL